MRHDRTLALLLALLVSGCYGEPSTPSLLVETTPPGASCVISQRGQPLATVEPTPAIGIVGPVAADIGILCRRPGFADAAVTIPPPSPTGSGRVEITMLPAPR